MSYGSTSYGSASFGSLSASKVVFFVPTELLSAGLFRRSTEYLGSAFFYEIVTKLVGAFEDPERVMRVYSHNDPGETPQLQVTVGLEADSTQSIVGAARFIVVEVEQPVEPVNFFSILITGNEYFQ